MTQALITEFKYLSKGDFECLLIRLPSAQNGNVIDLSTKGLGGLTVLAIIEYDASTTPVLLNTSLATLSGSTLTINNSSTRTILIFAR